MLFVKYVMNVWVQDLCAYACSSSISQAHFSNPSSVVGRQKLSVCTFIPLNWHAYLYKDTHTHGTQHNNLSLRMSWYVCMSCYLPFCRTCKPVDPHLRLLDSLWIHHIAHDRLYTDIDPVGLVRDTRISPCRPLLADILQKKMENCFKIWPTKQTFINQLTINHKVKQIYTWSEKCTLRSISRCSFLNFYGI